MRILISPLDWGLGHATRCIPLIHSFLQNGCKVYVACNATQQHLLKKEFSDVCFLPLAGYNIRYASSKRWFAAKILQQIPKIISAIRREHKWLQNAVKEHQIDMVISDNRFGFYHKTIPSVFITHQLLIQTPNATLSRWVQKINYQFINRFGECWVPDYKEDMNLAGILSHPKRLPSTPVTYIGPLSRLTKQENETKEYKWLILLSGPEPQRTLLENVLIEEFIKRPEKVLLIRGLPSNEDVLSLPAQFSVFNHLPTEQLNKILAQSEFIICRSGYTTVMELISLQKKALLIPTPGQTEQEYLAVHLFKQHWCFCCPTTKELPQSLEQINAFNFQLPQLPGIDLDKIVKSLVHKYSR